jgi:hypothetical protein
MSRKIVEAYYMFHLFQWFSTGVPWALLMCTAKNLSIVLLVCIYLIKICFTYYIDWCAVLLKRLKTTVLFQSSLLDPVVHVHFNCINICKNNSTTYSIYHQILIEKCSWRNLKFGSMIYIPRVSRHFWKVVHVPS